MKIKGQVTLKGLSIPAINMTSETVDVTYDAEYTVAELAGVINLIDMIPAKIKVLGEAFRTFEDEDRRCSKHTDNNSQNRGDGHNGANNHQKTQKKNRQRSR
jgi:hypothetical protein